eukprot:543736-Rhodomonas_salina.1
MKHAHASSACWVLAVALNEGAEKARAIPTPPCLKLSEEDLDAAISNVARLRDVALGERTEPVAAAEHSFCTASSSTRGQARTSRSRQEAR